MTMLPCLNGIKTVGVQLREKGQQVNGNISLKEKISRGKLIRLMAAHNPMSALISEEAGFDGVWASGFEYSASLGVPDASIYSMSDHLGMVSWMADRISIPIIADVDTGFGNAINVHHTVRKYEKAGAAGIVIEDKVFPKMSSLAQSSRHQMVSIPEFQGKIAAAVDARTDGDFLLIARVEALIAGAGEEEALARAHSYEKAGADLILIHSKRSSSSEIESFIKRWDGNVPIVIVPTSYPDLTESRIRFLKKVGIVIYGNHAMRASVKAMQDIFARIIKDGGIHNIGEDIVSVSEIFRLQGMEKEAALEKQFLK